MDGSFTVYCMTFPNGKRYIGQTKNISNRWGSNGARYKKSHVGRAIDKYGWENIQKEILVDDLSAEEVDEIERHYISFYDTTNREKGYNRESGGSKLKQVSDVTKEKHRQYALGVPQSEEQRRKSSESHKKYFKDHPEAREHYRQKTIEYFNAHPEEKAKRVAAMNKNRDEFEEKRKQRARESMFKLYKKIGQYSPDGELIKEWDSMSAAAKGTGIPVSNICAACKGRHNLIGGFKWKYIEV